MYIINNKTYCNYVDSQIYFTLFQKNYLKNLREKKGNIYKTIKSNKQTYTYIYNVYKEENIIKISKLILLFTKFISYKRTVELINLIRYNKMLDTQIIEWIKKKKFSNKSLYNIKQIYSSWTYIFEKLAQNCNNLFKRRNMDIKNIKYLDIGCGNGKKTIQFSNLLELEKENINGTDIKKQTSYSFNFNFKFILDNGKLDYPDNSFDFITCILMLHHVNDLKQLIKEIKRVLKPNGILLMIEHDTHDDYDKLILNILHTFYRFFVDKDENTIANPSRSQYFNWCEWDYIFLNKNDFSFIQANYIHIHIQNDIRFDNIYYCFYRNIDDTPVTPVTHVLPIYK